MTQQNLSIPNDFVFQVEPPTTLADLFAESDLIGDKYLEPSEVETRDADLSAAIAAVDEMLKPASAS